ncbi:MAG: decaprenyl-phosphate phosphoribosyltransferase [bacterium]
MQIFLAFLENLRPRQWTKNLILFAGVIFAQLFGTPAYVIQAGLGVLVFCLASGAVYIYNDAADVELDRLHPYKRLRPIASGRLPIRLAFYLAGLLMVACLFAAYLLGSNFCIVTGVFFLHNIIYTRLLKRAVILDVVGIAFSFVIRAVASVEVLREVVPSIHISNWLLLCTFFLSLFLGFGKRRHEVINVQPSGRKTRPALASYSEPLLNVMIGITFALTLMAYSLYTVWPGTIAHFGTNKLVYTLPFVFYGMGRYLFLVYKEGRGGRPHEILLNDVALQLGVGGWIASVILIIGLHA